MQKTQQLSVIIPAEYRGLRLDQALAQIFPDYSRSTIKEWIVSGSLRLNAEQVKPRLLVRGGECVDCVVESKAEISWSPEHIPLEIIYEDAEIIVINKPAGLVAHPAPGNLEGTLLNALLHYDQELVYLPRAGIVHRLDKDTTGLLVIARTERACNSLTRQLKTRTLTREYQAVVQGNIISGGIINLPIGRHPHHRIRMAVVPGGKESITHYRVKRQFRAHTHLVIRLETGRTHQIRVHMSHQLHPLVGDPLYGSRVIIPPESSDLLIETLQQFPRQALHACRLKLLHPATEEEFEWEAPLPTDMKQLIKQLSDDVEANSCEEPNEYY